MHDSAQAFSSIFITGVSRHVPLRRTRPNGGEDFGLFRSQPGRNDTEVSRYVTLYGWLLMDGGFRGDIVGFIHVNELPRIRKQ